MKIDINSRRKFIKQLSAAGIGLGINSKPEFRLFHKSVMPNKRIGLIGLDTSHSIEFTKILNANNAGPQYRGYKITAAYPFGSKAIENGSRRIADYTKEIQEYKVRIVSSIEELLKEVDVIMLETNDGRMHYSQASAVLGSGKPIFIDKPFAASLADVKRIFSEAERYQTPVFSSSALRYLPSVEAIRHESIGKVQGADIYSPAFLEKSHPDLFWYGIHGVEMLFSVMGTGCAEVSRVHAANTDIVIGRWSDDRLGVARGFRSGKTGFGGTVYGETSIARLGTFTGYNSLLEQIMVFFESKIPPVNAKETIEIYAFMEAADISRRSGGIPIRLTVN